MSRRLIFFTVFAACAGLMGFGLYLQHVEHLEPCPLCIFQRYAFVATGAIALVATLHGPGRWGQVVYGALLAVSAGIGAAIAGRQTWLQHNPPQVFDCGPDLGYMLDSFPLTQVLPKVFKGEGDCASAGWKFLNLSIAEWALLWFLAFIAVGLYLAVTRLRSAVA
ncbi:MAG TPA: disulfide bond formation protein B [Burkholderiales bacterium]|nr:disulfide bond formation protein B [Burkholderiales bacterium]